LKPPLPGEKPVGYKEKKERTVVCGSTSGGGERRGGKKGAIASMVTEGSVKSATGGRGEREKRRRARPNCRAKKGFANLAVSTTGSWSVKVPP